MTIKVIKELEPLLDISLAPFFFKSPLGNYCGTEDDFTDDYVKYQSAWTDTENVPGGFLTDLTEGSESIDFEN